MPFARMMYFSTAAAVGVMQFAIYRRRTKVAWNAIIFRKSGGDLGVRVAIAFMFV